MFVFFSCFHLKNNWYSSPELSPYFRLWWPSVLSLRCHKTIIYHRKILSRHPSMNIYHRPHRTVSHRIIIEPPPGQITLEPPWTRISPLRTNTFHQRQAHDTKHHRPTNSVPLQPHPPNTVPLQLHRLSTVPHRPHPLSTVPLQLHHLSTVPHRPHPLNMVRRVNNTKPHRHRLLHHLYTVRPANNTNPPTVTMDNRATPMRHHPNSMEHQPWHRPSSDLNHKLITTVNHRTATQIMDKRDTVMVEATHTATKTKIM